jgi:uncharacterized membrane protein YvbJ
VKSPHFFCETCGAQVPRSAKDCPDCGSRFASVLCPSCKFSGEEKLFAAGCPSCGYSAKTGQKSSLAESKKAKWPKNSSPLPIWLYILTAGAFVLVFTALLFRIF